MKKKFKLLVFLLLLLMPCFAVWAANVGFISSNIWLSKERPIVNDQIKIYAVIVNDGDKDIDGRVIFYDNNQAISSPANFYLAKGGTSQIVSTDWQAIFGNHQFKAIIDEVNLIDVSGTRKPASGIKMSQMTSIIYVDVDSDQDGLPDQEEAKEGTDPKNPDSDKDGDLDGVDPSPLNAKIFSGPDTDKDGIADKIDTDTDNDGLYNWEEEALGTDPYKYDSDNDGCNDKEDYYPLDSKRCKNEEIGQTESEDVSNQPIKTEATKSVVLGAEDVNREAQKNERIKSALRLIINLILGIFVILAIIIFAIKFKKFDPKPAKKKNLNNK